MSPLKAQFPLDASKEPSGIDGQRAIEQFVQFVRASRQSIAFDLGIEYISGSLDIRRGRMSVIVLAAAIESHRSRQIARFVFVVDLHRVDAGSSLQMPKWCREPDAILPPRAFRE